MGNMTTHIVTMGGGGFSMSADGAVTQLDRYIVGLANKERPLVCFVPTASADDPKYINRFLTAYGPMGVRTVVMTLWDDARNSVKRAREADVFVVGGGSTVNLVALWNAHGVSDMFRTLANERDVVFAGSAAGGSAWYEACTTDSFGTEMQPWWGGLGMVKGSFCPHYDGEEQRAPLYAQAVAEGRLPDGFGADNGAAVHFIDGVPKRFVAERRRATVYKVYGNFSPVTSGVIVEPQKMRLLGH